MQEGEYTAVGETTERRADVRVIGATNQPEGSFRHELLHRFRRRVRIPPLRERREDIPLLIRHWLVRQYEANPERVSRFLVKGPSGALEPRINGRAVDYLIRHPLPGNVRQLEAFLETALDNSLDDQLRLPDSITKSMPVPPSAEPRPSEPPAAASVAKTTDRGTDETPSREKILAHLERAGGNVSEAATTLGLQRSRLYRLMDGYGIKRGKTGS
jgi:DNA-binding NtrC family response regulator